MKKIILALLIWGLMLSAVNAEYFVNWKAGYYVEYPDTWEHVPYSTVNAFLRTQDMNPEELNYEGVLALKTDKPFFEGPYVFMLTSLSDKFTSSQIDSVLKMMEDEYDHKVKRHEIKSDEVILGLDQPVFDATKNYVVTKSRISSEYADKFMLEFRKFYEKGIAYFIFYATKDNYNEYQPTFIDIVNSFSTKDIESVAPKEKAVVVNPEDRKLDSYDEGDFTEEESNGGFSTIYIIIAGLIVVAVIATVIIRKR